MGLAMPLAFLRRAGFQPEALDLPIEGFDEERIRRARFIGISVPMHTALRLGVRAARRVRTVNPTCHICFYGLYATLNSEFLLGHEADFVIGGEYEEALARLVTILGEGKDDSVEGVASARHAEPPSLERLPFPVPLRMNLPQLAN